VVGDGALSTVVLEQRVRVSAFSVMLFVCAGYVRAQAISCESMSLDPVTPEGVRVLGRFIERSGGVGGLGCWVHPHPNERDFVVTPYSWGQTPNAGHQDWIDITMEVITKAREVLTQFGTLDVDLNILLSDLSDAASPIPGEAVAYWLLEDDCWIEALKGSREDLYGLGNRENTFRGTLAHEIGHCFLMENIPNYVPDTFWDITARWWDESGAEFLSAQVYPFIDHEFYYAGLFDMDGKRWLQTYTAYVVLQHYANQNDARAVMKLLEWFHQQGKEVRPFLDAIYNHPTFGDFYHDFVVTHYQTQVKDAGSGTIPREANVDNFFEQMLVPESGKVPIPLAPANRLVLVEMTIPSRYDLRLKPPTGSDKRHFETLWENGRFIQDWAGKVEVEGDCEYDTQARVLLTHHHETTIEGLEMEYWLDEKCPCGDETVQDCCRRPRTSDLQPRPFRPYYEGSDPKGNWGACNDECKDACWCRNKNMWSFEPVSLTECNQYFPGGTESIQHPTVSTLCEGMTHPSNRRIIAKKDALQAYCALTVCAEKCGPMPRG
jgi:hypothetical protein